VGGAGGWAGACGGGGGGGSSVGPSRGGAAGGGLGATSAMAGQVSNVIDSVPGGVNVNLPVDSPAGVMSMVLWNNNATRFLNLELSALESDGRGRVVSSPRVLTRSEERRVGRAGAG